MQEQTATTRRALMGFIIRAAPASGGSEVEVEAELASSLLPEDADPADHKHNSAKSIFIFRMTG